MKRPLVSPSVSFGPTVNQAIRAEETRFRREHRAQSRQQKQMLRHGRKSALKVVRRLLRGLNNRKVS